MRGTPPGLQLSSPPGPYADEEVIDWELGHVEEYERISDSEVEDHGEAFHHVEDASEVPVPGLDCDDSDLDEQTDSSFGSQEFYDDGNVVFFNEEVENDT